MAAILSFDNRVLTSTDGASIYAQANGNPENRALIFIHGFALSASVFNGLLSDDRLLKDFYLVAYDLRGYGRSSMPLVPEGHVSSLQAADFEALLKEFKIANPLVVAWSMGGAIVADIFAHLPAGTIAGVVYINGIPSMGPIALEAGSPESAAFLADLLSLDNTTASTAARATFVDACFSRPEDLSAEFKWSWMGMTLMQSPAVAVLTVTREQDPSNLFKAAATEFPALYIVGSADKIMLGELKVEPILKKSFKNLEVHRIAGGSHAPFIDSKEEVVDQLVRFGRKIFDNVEE
ncbi:hypothetical protein D9611_003055 [Ephemerocybe angulata]|uniref:AB hydrolase-1 domain-containing protein n=1 Tax=Ephemerocybe angulata TaxID=980116 RepID=A0A8H5C8H2_9AGAR|nr:hypothetical protein D9611_003055 [Tulosesus angulatus]